MKLFFTLISCLLSYCCFGQVLCTHCSGFKVFGPEALTSIEETENVRLLGTKVNTLNVKGHLYSENAHINQLTVSGKASIINSVILDKTIIDGQFEAVDSQFQNISIINNNTKIILNNCTANNIIIKNHGDLSPVLELRNGTTILGSITFESNPGIIYLKSNSTIKGSINNAAIK